LWKNKKPTELIFETFKKILWFKMHFSPNFQKFYVVVTRNIITGKL